MRHSISEETMVDVPMQARDPRDAAVDALLELAASRPWAEITLPDIAERAGVTLKDLRAHFPSKGAILGAFSRRIDLAVLEGDGKDLAEEPARERLFDVLMRRLDALRPYKPALRSIRAGLRREPLSAAAMNQTIVTSMRWMLAAAGINEEGPLGTAKAQALAIKYSRVLDTFLHDEDPGLSRTLKALDREMRSAERWARRGHDVHELADAIRRTACRISGRGRDRHRDDPVATEEPSPSI
jgi:AcrR family transcriptional regulator